jgi:hypothetical protein
MFLHLISKYSHQKLNDFLDFGGEWNSYEKIKITP